MIPQLSVWSVLPPFVGPAPCGNGLMSPYPATLVEVIYRYATSPHRIAILLGLIDFRSALRAAGLHEGWQWINGSFVEDIEHSRARSPADVDVVTFCHFGPLTSKRTIVASQRDLFEAGRCRKKYHCDAYFVDLDVPPELVVQDSCYWLSLFSHQRTTLRWKGMIKVPLADDDKAATLRLREIGRQAGDSHAEQIGT